MVNTSEMEQTAAGLCPVDTGTMKRDLSVSTEITPTEGTIGVHVLYGPYVEWGTRFMAAKPFIKPAFVKQKGQFIKDLERCMK